MRGCSSINYRNTRTRWRFTHAWRGSIRSRKSVRGGAAWTGRTVGGMDAAIEPPWMGLRRVLPVHAALPTHGMPAFAVEVAGPRPVLPEVQGAACRRTRIKKQQAEACCFGVMVRPERFELPTAWFVARYSIQLSYGRAVHNQILKHFQRRMLKTCRVVRPERFELPTAWFVARYSIQLSYGRPATGAELCGCRRGPSTVL